MDQPNAALLRISGTINGDSFSAQDDLAVAGLQDAINDIHHGGLACSVFTCKSVDFALTQFKRDALQRFDRSE